MRFLRSPHGPGAVLLDKVAVALGVQEGVVDAADGMMSRQAANTIRVAAGKGWVDGDAVAGIGTGRIYAEWDQTDVTVPNAGAGLFRIDQLVAVLQGGHGSKALVTRVAGATENAGHVLDTGAAYGALPAGALRLGAVRSGATGVADTTATNMRDRRPWARGAFDRRVGAGSYSRAIVGYAAMDATLLQSRIECSGVPLRVRLVGGRITNAGGYAADFRLSVDGSAIIESSMLDGVTAGLSGGYWGPVFLDVTFTPAAGSHLLVPEWTVNAGTSTYSTGSLTAGPVLTVEEIMRPAASNGSA